ncbi:hypothetical protein, partial [uncultured Acetatifactor sp.]|uniref:hypothetical protein n=1 Tax=uncultured Acetatifactor sp. TaxID=1671927 RepID=UPI00262E9E25
ALLDWNIQGRIAVHLSRCLAVFISGNFDRISQLSAFVNNFLKLFSFHFFNLFRLAAAFLSGNEIYYTTFPATCQQ